jgi:TfoX/Sxy family transcriptional regulator of competence genes
MSYDRELEASIQRHIREAAYVKRHMFGGICYLWRGNMAFGIWQDQLIARIGPDAAAVVDERGIRVMDVTGRPMKGWVMVAPGIWRDPARLAEWLDRAGSFAATLPPKG